MVEALAGPTARWLAVGTEFDPEPTAPRAARAFLKDVLAVWDCDDEDQVAAVLTSEVVTNAIRHTAGKVSLRITLAVDIIRVEATDGEPGPVRALPLDVTADGGRGLFLVEMLARDWGAFDHEDGGGKIVWFELPVRRRHGPYASIAAGC
jgi:anti-sigma regulatory factor (Ser/Thr protein kinase)